MGYRREVFFLAAILAIGAVQAIHADRKILLRDTKPAYAIASYLDLLNASSQCRTDMKRFRDGVDSGTLWSLRMLDASGEPESGYTGGNNFWVGKVQQCKFLSTNTTLPVSPTIRRNNSLFRDPATEYPPFGIQFFVARMLQNSTTQYHIEIRGEDLVLLGLCMPESCTEEELAILVEKVVRDRVLLVSQLYAADFKLLEVSDLRDDHQWLLSGKIIIIILILLLMVGLVIIGTLYDVLVYQKRLRKKTELLKLENKRTAELKIDAEAKHEAGHEGTESSNLTPETKFWQIILCFSAYSNIKRLFDTNSSSDSIRMFHGLKFYGMMWITIIHMIYFSSPFVGNRSAWLTIYDSWVLRIVSNGSFSVDTFFCISGFLLAYSYLQAQKKEKVVSWHESATQFYMMILKRYIRLTPAYLVIILVSILNYSWHDRISMFRYNEQIDEMCSKYWWRNLLYINNFYSQDELCLSWSWFVTNDMQFFVFGSFLLVLSTKYLYTALSLGTLAMFGSMIVTGYIGYSVNYYPTLNELIKTLDKLYMAPWTRITPYLIGMLTGCLLTKWNTKLHLSKKVKILGWTFGIMCNCLILLGPGIGEITFTGSIFYTTLSRTAWGLGIMWLIIACLTNNGGIVGRFLSMQVWIPFSRLTYTLYLVNPFLIISIYLLSCYPVYTDFVMSSVASLGVLLVSYVCAMVLTLVAETPAIMLLRLLVPINR